MGSSRSFYPIWELHRRKGTSLVGRNRSSQPFGAAATINLREFCEQGEAVYVELSARPGKPESPGLATSPARLNQCACDRGKRRDGLAREITGGGGQLSLWLRGIAAIATTGSNNVGRAAIVTGVIGI